MKSQRFDERNAHDLWVLAEVKRGRGKVNQLHRIARAVALEVGEVRKCLTRLERRGLIRRRQLGATTVWGEVRNPPRRVLEARP
jgi:hypothetical protein